MEFLSLEKDPEPRGPRFTRTDAILTSVGIHVVLLLMLLWLPTHLPESIRRFLEPKPMVVASSPIRSAEDEVLVQPHAVPKKPLPHIPLKFAYVKVPDDTPSPKNPDAHLLSDKDRRARQEMPTPPDARQFSRDPHSTGDTIDRVKPDPRIAAGHDTPKPPEPAAEKGPETPTAGTGAARDGTATVSGNDEATIARASGPPGELAPSSPDGLRPRPAGGGSSGSSGGPSGAPARSPADSKPGTEYKFNFNNQGWLRGGAYGTLSFDTQGFPWGDYARQIYVIIRNNWLDRIPLAARENIAGYTCQHFVIAKSGTITDLDVTRTSSVPPFNKAASDALRASSPLPPLPADFPDPQEGVTFCFFYNMYPGEGD